MKHFKKLKTALSGVALSVVLLASSVSGAYALGSPDKKQDRGATPPSTSFSSGPQAKAPVEPGAVDAKVTEKLGKTKEVDISSDGSLKAQADVAPMAGNVANVDFQTPLNYCYKHLTYLPVKNSTAVTKYLQVRIYNNGTYQEKYVTVAANSTAYVAFYGVEGTYYGYLYVWNGSSYQYDEYVSNENTCKVAVTRTYNTGGWVQLKIENTGTAYVTQKSSELAPFPASGTYTGTHYDYPTAGGAAIYRWFWVSTSPYGIVSDTYGSTSNPWLFTGDL
jgi:hypothetical protein